MPSLWRHSAGLLRAPFQELAFALRSRVRWSRGLPPPAAEPKDDARPWLLPEAGAAACRRAESLARSFDLAALTAASSRLVHAENLALLDRLEALSEGVTIPVGPDGKVLAVDLGSGAFQYATALHRWLARHGGGVRSVALRGIEIDGHGVYRDGHSRADHARAHARIAGPQVAYEVADITRLDLPRHDVVSMFFPFLSAYALLAWGSPLSHLKPRRVLRRAVAAVRPGGLLVIANQTEAEFERLRALLLGQPVTLERRIAFATDLVPYAERTAGRVGSLWRRNSLPEADALR